MNERCRMFELFEMSWVALVTCSVEYLWFFMLVST